MSAKLCGFTKEQFLADVKDHVMEIIRDDGLCRHIRFKRPGSYCMHFDLVTWRGHLCYTGDMGTYVFSRLDDMFEFFRGGERNIDYSYWAQKVLAQDKSDGIESWDENTFVEQVTQRVNDDVEAGYIEPDDAGALLAALKDEVFYAAGDGQHFANAALYQFEHKGWRFEFDGWSPGTVWAHRFLWCCCAISWGITKYDAEAK